MNKQILTFKELREAKGYTQESLGQAVGLSRLAIAKYELKQAEPKLGNFLKIARILEVSLAELALAMGYETEEESVQVCKPISLYTPAQNGVLERESVQVVNDNPEYTPVKRRTKGKGTGFIEERLVKRGDKQYKQYWFHWQKSEPGKRRVLARSKYIPKRLVAKIIENNNQKLPVREILKSLGAKK
ncbi:putative transcriptional regulator [Xenococcus sp. PCC 7305]|uniref:helix-turn-helix domain-containing protein n=1 Tax=Xenococcus sp. PCC 7305 TaxID=102125 RepID=UPI0002ABC290|nr:helix-turn-helix transcriptional regulator [Xenococcus sp. PCC 7305]ELS04071.1 putative transcriptional regulator [Xenococcus sp. PCC 7305]